VGDSDSASAPRYAVIAANAFYERISVFIISDQATVDDICVVREIAQGLNRYFLTLKIETKVEASL
jgi:hypothetical protein